MAKGLIHTGLAVDGDVAQTLADVAAIHGDVRDAIVNEVFEGLGLDLRSDQGDTIDFTNEHPANRLLHATRLEIYGCHEHLMIVCDNEALNEFGEKGVGDIRDDETVGATSAVLESGYA